MTIKSVRKNNKMSKKTSGRSRASAHRRSSRATATPRSVTRSAVDAVVELGEAAKAIQVSLSHVKAAKERGKKVLRPLARTGKAAARTVVQAVKKRLPGKKRR